MVAGPRPVTTTEVALTPGTATTRCTSSGFPVASRSLSTAWRCTTALRGSPWPAARSAPASVWTDPTTRVSTARSAEVRVVSVNAVMGRTLPSGAGVPGGR